MTDDDITQKLQEMLASTVGPPTDPTIVEVEVVGPTFLPTSEGWIRAADHGIVVDRLVLQLMGSRLVGWSYDAKFPEPVEYVTLSVTIPETP